MSRRRLSLVLGILVLVLGSGGYALYSQLGPSKDLRNQFATICSDWSSSRSSYLGQYTTKDLPDRYQPLIYSASQIDPEASAPLMKILGEMRTIVSRGAALQEHIDTTRSLIGLGMDISSRLSYFESEDRAISSAVQTVGTELDSFCSNNS